MLKSLFRTSEPKMPVIERPITNPWDMRPPLKNVRLEKKPAHVEAEETLKEYAKLAEEIGVQPPDLRIENFKALLAKLDYPIFSLLEVISYMDMKAANESKEKAGWLWRPLRETDQKILRKTGFGRGAEREHGGGIEPSSDYYHGENMSYHRTWHGEGIKGGAPLYDRTVPLHALRRIAMIEREYKDPVGFVVSDYAPAPQIQYPDPFLMAVIPNINADKGEGRFVIDFWDEPGFGIQQMLK